MSQYRAPRNQGQVGTILSFSYNGYERTGRDGDNQVCFDFNNKAVAQYIRLKFSIDQLDSKNKSSSDDDLMFKLMISNKNLKYYVWYV